VGKVRKLKEKRLALRLLVTGGRDYNDEEFVALVLKRYNRKAKSIGRVLVVINGGARGLDTLAKNWCLKHGVPCITMDASWDYYRNSAGPIRNGWMLEFCAPTHCYVFPGGTGTNDMMKQAKADNLIMASHEDEE